MMNNREQPRGERHESCRPWEYGVPRLGEFDEPFAGEGTGVVDVTASAIRGFDINFASGRHYLKPATLPAVAGHNGVGRLGDGRRVYFEVPIPPFGAMAQRTLVSEQHLVAVPEGVDDAVAAALGNTGLAAWLLLAWRARVTAGETVLVLGATGIVGRLAVQVARLLGAGRVVAAGRDAGALQQVQELGADAVVRLDASDNLPAGRLSRRGPGRCLNYLPLALHAFHLAREGNAAVVAARAWTGQAARRSTLQGSLLLTVPGAVLVLALLQAASHCRTAD